MKTIIIILSAAALIFFIAQAFIMQSTQKTEKHKYSVLKDFGSFEIRKYEPALFSYVVMQADSYKSVSSKGFGKLA